jgi:CRP-like cAMP-binding protein
LSQPNLHDEQEEPCVRRGRVSPSRKGGENNRHVSQPTDVIFSQGDTSESVLYIQNGVVKLSVLSHGGKEAVVAMLGPQDFFGERALTGHRVRLETATAVTATTVLIVPKRQMIRALHEQARAVGSVHHAHARPQRSDRRRPRRSVVQFQREAVGLRARFLKGAQIRIGSRCPRGKTESDMAGA